MKINDATKFGEEVDAMISDLEGQFGFTIIRKDKSDFARIDQAINETVEHMKKGRFPDAGMRTKMWERLNNCRTSLKKIKNEYYTERKEKFERRQKHSASLKDRILETIEACEPESPLDKLLVYTGEILSYLTPLGFISKGFGYLFKAFETGMGIETEKPQNPLKIKSQALRDVRALIIDQRELLTREHKDELFARWDAVKQELDSAWVDFKEQAENRNRQWEVKQREFLEVLEEKLENKIANVSRQEDRMDNQIAYLAKIKNRLENQNDFLRGREEHLEKLEDDYNNAWSDSFRDNCSDWIDQTKDKITEVESDIKNLIDKIQEIETEIEELPDRIQQAKDAIISLKEKIREVREKLNG